MGRGVVVGRRSALDDSATRRWRTQLWADSNADVWADSNAIVFIADSDAHVWANSDADVCAHRGPNVRPNECTHCDSNVCAHRGSNDGSDYVVGSDDQRSDVWPDDPGAQRRSDGRPDARPIVLSDFDANTGPDVWSHARAHHAGAFARPERGAHASSHDSGPFVRANPLANGVRLLLAGRV